MGRVMRLRRRATPELPGIHGVARVERRLRQAPARLRPGDILVLNHLDLDRDTAQAIVDSGAVAVLNGSPMLSGRFPARGAGVLVDGGVLILDRLGADAVAAIPDGSAVRIDGDQIWLDEVSVGSGRVVDASVLSAEVAAADQGMTAQLEVFTRNSAEFVRREAGLLLHDEGLPDLRSAWSERPVVVVADAAGHQEQLAAARRFLTEQRPVFIGVQRGADSILAAGYRPQVIVVDATAEAPSAKALRAARDVVVRVDRGAGRVQGEDWERLGVRPSRCECGVGPEDLALLIADRGGASVIIGAGLHATLSDFLDRQRPGLAGTYLTRLKVGPGLVEAAALPVLYAGRVRPRHLLGVTLAGLAAVAAAVFVTPVGHQWLQELTSWLTATGSDLGLFS